MPNQGAELAGRPMGSFGSPRLSATLRHSIASFDARMSATLYAQQMQGALIGFARFGGVDGAIIRVKMLGFAMPFPTRMTMVYLGRDALFIHSPTTLRPELKAEVEALAAPRDLVGSSWLHY